MVMQTEVQSVCPLSQGSDADTDALQLQYIHAQGGVSATCGYLLN